MIKVFKEKLAFTNKLRIEPIAWIDVLMSLHSWALAALAGADPQFIYKIVSKLKEIVYQAALSFYNVKHIEGLYRPG